MAERTLVTGALGCIGAWVLKTLLDEGEAPVAFDVAARSDRLELVLTPEEREQVEFVIGDVAEKPALIAALREHEITRVVHLAALQVPFARADPPLGALVNVVGTVNVFEAVKELRERIPHVVYASSVAALYADGEEGPSTHYGVYKLANEGNARVFSRDDGIPSVGLRPSVVYGVGRDQGLTSSPTKAMLAAALGQGYRIEYGGRAQLQYAPDTARAFVAASRSQVDGARVHNLGGPPVHMREIVAAIERAAPEAGGEIGFDDIVLPFPDELDDEGLVETLGPLAPTPLDEGVIATIAMFRRLRDEGRLEI